MGKKERKANFKMFTSKKLVFGITGIVLLFVILFTHHSFASSYSSTSLSRKALSSSGLQDLAQRTNLKVIEEDFQNIAVVRVPDTPSHTQVQKYILNELKNFPSWHVETHQFTDKTPFGDKVFSNIIATWTPAATRKSSDPTQHRRVILSAHYDSKYFKDFDFIAATDSAVPCAILLDIARTLDMELSAAAAKPNTKVNPNLSLQLVFFDGEEAFVDWTNTDSKYGSKQLAAKWEEADKLFEDATDKSVFNRHREGINNIELFILLDLLGAKRPIPQIRSFFEDTAEPFRQFFKIEGLLAKQNLYELSNVPEHRRKNPYISTGSVGPYKVDDDHAPFMQRGVPIIHFIPTEFPSVWHTKSDNEQAVDWVQVENLATLFRCWVAQYFNLL